MDFCQLKQRCKFLAIDKGPEPVSILKWDFFHKLVSILKWDFFHKLMKRKIKIPFSRD
jgi:hypothetical protein